MSEQYMDKKQFAALFNVSTRTVNRWMAQEAVNPLRRGRIVRFGPRQIEEAKIYLGEQGEQSQNARVN